MMLLSIAVALTLLGGAAGLLPGCDEILPTTGQLGDTEHEADFSSLLSLRLHIERGHGHMTAHRAQSRDPAVVVHPGAPASPTLVEHRRSMENIPSVVLAAAMLSLGIMFFLFIVSALVIRVSHMHVRQPPQDLSPLAVDSAPNEYRPDIDGLRAVAVIAVVIYHIESSWLPGGFIGVDMFFVISGYVIASSLAHRPSQNVLDYLMEFYSRRMKRLAPSLVVVVCTTALWMSLLLPPWLHELGSFYQVGMLSLVGWSNNYFYFSYSTSYFAVNADLSLNPFMHTWSLGVEEQFYIVFPLVAYGFHRKQVSASTSSRLSHVTPPVILFICCVTSVFFCARYSTGVDKENKAAFFTLPSRFWELAAGALVLQSESGYGSILASALERRLVSHALELAAASLLIAAVWITPAGGHGGFPFPWALLPVFGTICYIVAGSGPHAYLNKCLSLFVPVYIGRISYPIYLWHWPVLVFVDMTFGVNCLGWKLISLIVVAWLSMISYHLLEGSFRAWHPSKHGKVFGVLVPIVGVSLLWLQLLRGPLYGKLFLNPYYGIASTVAPVETQGSECACVPGDPTFHRPACSQSSDPTRALPRCFLDTAPSREKPSMYLKGPQACYWDCGEVPDLQYARLGRGGCLTPDRGPAGNKRALFLFGDSHAASVSMGLREAVSDELVFASLTNGGCGFRPPSVDLPRPPACDRYNKEVMDSIARVVNRSDIVTVQSDYTYFPTNRSLFDQANYLRTLHDMVSARGASLLVLGDVPHLRARGLWCVPTLLSPNASRRCDRPKQQVMQLMAPWRNMLSDLAKQHRDIYFFDYLDLFCDDNTCGAMIPGTRTLGFFDTSHLTEAGSHYLWPYIRSFLKRSGLLPAP